MTSSNNYHLKAFWIEDSKTTHQKNPDFCNISKKALKPKGWKPCLFQIKCAILCFNFSGVIHSHKRNQTTLNFKYYIAIAFTREPHALCTKPTDVAEFILSWNAASKSCMSAGGTLPIFRSADELDDFVALLKQSPYKHITYHVMTPSPEAFELVFIGLTHLMQWKRTTKVFPFTAFCTN